MVGAADGVALAIAILKFFRDCFGIIVESTQPWDNAVRLPFSYV